jgi:N-dimethylarginine dimethylaminohydrolase
MCPPTHFNIVKPINATQWLYYSDGLPTPEPLVMVQQHQKLIEVLQREGVEVGLLPQVPRLPYQHATRDVGVVIGDTIVLSSLKEETRRLEAEIAEPAFQKYRLKTLAPDKGFIEGGDVIVDTYRLWVGLGARSDEWGAERLHRIFRRDYEVIPLHFDPQYTRLDTIFGVRSRAEVMPWCMGKHWIHLLCSAFWKLIHMS